MLLPLLMLITIFLIDHTLGKAFSSQCNNKDIFWKQNSRGMQRAKEMLSSNQANFHRNPRKSEINDSSTFEWLSVPIPNDIPASTMGSFLSQLTVVPTSSSLHFHVPTNATSTATGLTSLNDVTIAHVSTMCGMVMRFAGLLKRIGRSNEIHRPTEKILAQQRDSPAR